VASRGVLFSNVVPLLIGATIATSGPSTVLRTTSPRTWTFESDRLQAPPSGFFFARTGDGRPGQWVVTRDDTRPPGHAVLSQLDRDETDYRFPVAVVNGPQAADLDLRVQCKPVEGKVDQAGGLVFRYKDENNYYLVRLNALENNVRLYHVQDGRRIQFAGWNGKVSKNTWHELEVRAKGATFVIVFDHQTVIEAEDHTFGEAGQIGVWTKADSVTSFDDLSVSVL